MSTAATLISEIGTYNWNARLHNVLALASQLAAAVKARGNAVRIAYNLHSLNKSVHEFITIVNETMEGKRKSNQKTDVVTPQTLRSSADNLEEMYRTLEYIVEGARRAGLMNNSLTGGSIRGIQRNTEAIASLADWFDLAAQPEDVAAIFERAEHERDSGQLIDLTQVE